MIVDVYTHVWETPQQLGAAAAARFRRQVAAPWERELGSAPDHDVAMADVDIAFVHGLVSRRLGADITPAQVARYVARQPARYRGFAGIDPNDPACIEQLETARRLGLVGLTLSPAAQGFHPTHTQALALYERCAKTGLPVFFLTAAALAPQAALELAQPYLLDEVARSFPGLPLVVGAAGDPWVDQTLTLLEKHEHVYAELSGVVRRPWQLYHVLAAAQERGVAGKLLLGSGFPWGRPADAIAALRHINHLVQGTGLVKLSAELLHGIVQRDALQCLGLAAPPAPVFGRSAAAGADNIDADEAPQEQNAKA